MDVLTISWGWIGGYPRAVEQPQEGAGVVFQARPIPRIEEDDDELFILLLTQILLSE